MSKNATNARTNNSNDQEHKNLTIIKSVRINSLRSLLNYADDKQEFANSSPSSKQWAYWYKTNPKPDVDELSFIERFFDGKNKRTRHYMNGTIHDHFEFVSLRTPASIRSHGDLPVLTDKNLARQYKNFVNEMISYNKGLQGKKRGQPKFEYKAGAQRASTRGEVIENTLAMEIKTPNGSHIQFMYKDRKWYVFAIV